MRGKDGTEATYSSCGGITPAYAGKSDLLQASEHCQQDHPRLCGEKIGCFFVSFGGLGSPPPMRGKD